VGFILTNWNWLLIAVALVSGGMLLWPLLASRTTGAGGVTPAGAVQLINRQKAVVIDVGSPAEYAAAHVANARNAPLAELAALLPGLVKNKSIPLVLVADTGLRAARAASAAKKLGYASAQPLNGGLKGWRDAGLPVESTAANTKG
jgi:rhodanese-related sulfurtransferase